MTMIPDLPIAGCVIFTVFLLVFLEGLEPQYDFPIIIICVLLSPIVIVVLIARALRRKVKTGTFFME